MHLLLTIQVFFAKQNLFAKFAALSFLFEERSLHKNQDRCSSGLSHDWGHPPEKHVVTLFKKRIYKIF